MPRKIPLLSLGYLQICYAGSAVSGPPHHLQLSNLASRAGSPATPSHAYRDNQDYACETGVTPGELLLAGRKSLVVVHRASAGQGRLQGGHRRAFHCPWTFLLSSRPWSRARLGSDQPEKSIPRNFMGSMTANQEPSMTEPQRGRNLWYMLQHV